MTVLSAVEIFLEVRCFGPPRFHIGDSRIGYVAARSYCNYLFRKSPFQCKIRVTRRWAISVGLPQLTQNSCKRCFMNRAYLEVACTGASFYHTIKAHPFFSILHSPIPLYSLYIKYIPFVGTPGPLHVSRLTRKLSLVALSTSDIRALVPYWSKIINS